MTTIKDLGRDFLLGPSAAPGYMPNKTDGVVLFDEIDNRIVALEASDVAMETEIVALEASDVAMETEIAAVRVLATTTMQWKTAAKVGATANVTIASNLVNGVTLNGVTLATGDRVLLTAQTAAAENGLYVVVASGAASRATDADAASEMVGMAVFVTGGTTTAGKQYILSTPAPITVGTTALTFQTLSDQSALNTSISTLNAWMLGLKSKAVALSRPIAYDPHTRTLSVPSIYGLKSNGGTWSLSPVTGTNMRKTVESSGNLTVVYVDLADITANGVNSATALKLDTTYPSPLSQGTDGYALLGHIYSRKFFPAPGLIVAPVVANQFGCTNDDNDLADLCYTDSYPTSLTQSGSTAAGYTRGWTGTNVVGCYYGGRFAEPIRRGWVFYRFFIESDVADTYGTVRAMLVSPRITAGNTDMSPSVERKIDTHTKVYSGLYRLDGTTDFIGMWCGSTLYDGSVRVFGLQFAVLATDSGYVMEGDAPRSASLIGPRLRALESHAIAGATIDGGMIPSRLCFIEGRGYPLFVDQLFKSTPGPYQVSVAALNADNRRPLDHKTTGPVLDLNTARLGTTMVMTVNDRSTFGATGWQKDITTTVVAAASVAGHSPRVLMLGDSLTEWAGTAVQTYRRLQAITGTVPNFIGTIDLRDMVTPDALTVKGEGRQGREFADYIYEHTDDTSPVAVGGEATYLARSSSAKQAYNPFIRATVIGDDSTKVYNGYIFDFGFYLSRFGFTAPDVVVLNLGTNDITQNSVSATALTQIKHGLGVIVPSIRAAATNCIILVAWNPLGPISGDARWNGVHRNALRAVMSYVRALGDSKVMMLPAWCTVSRENGFSRTTVTTDSDTGVQSITAGDQIHYAAYGAAQYADMAAQFIAALTA